MTDAFKRRRWRFFCSLEAVRSSLLEGCGSPLLIRSLQEFGRPPVRIFDGYSHFVPVID